MKRTTILSCFLLLVNCATAISKEITCSHFDLSSSKNTEYAWFQLWLDEVQRDKNFILWQRVLDVESGEQSEPNVKLPAIYMSPREVLASTTRMVDLTDEQGALVSFSPMFYNIRLDLVTGELFLYSSLNFQNNSFASIGTTLKRYSCDL